MPALVNLVAAISNDLVAALALAGLPPLADGKIVLGRQRIMEQSAPPRVIFVPLKSKFGPRSFSTAAPINGNPTAELVTQWQERSIATDAVTFEAHCWGVSNVALAETDPDADFDATQVLYQALILSVHKLAVGRYKLLDGEWLDQAPSATQHVKYGHWYKFGIQLETPVLDVLLPLVTPVTTANPTTRIQLADGSPSEVGCQG
jgi:hypothetical protein